MRVCRCSAVVDLDRKFEGEGLMLAGLYRQYCVFFFAPGETRDVCRSSHTHYLEK